MGKSIFLLFVFFGFQQPSVTTITWKDLEDVTFEETYLDGFEDWFLVPTFGKDVKALEGKTVKIKGYLIPIDLDGKVYALSAYPFSSCFFCGAAGPESVMTLLFKVEKSRKYKTDEVGVFTGTLRLNPDDPEEFIYVLDGAVKVE